VILPRTFVRMLLPTREQPHVPDLLHIGYVLTAANQEAIVAFTTSQPWPAGTPLPAGARLFDAREAAQLNQSRAFMLRLDVLARLPLTRAWFPDMEQRDRGIIAVASASLRDELTRLAANLVRRHRDLLHMRGP
jgi:hypothetical protein